MFKRGSVVLFAIIVAACSGGNASPTPTPPGIVVTAGTWSYVLNAGVPLPQAIQGQASCAAPSVSGKTTVSSNGTFSIPFSGLTCSSCSMSGTVTGTIVPTSVSGNVTAVTSGAGCSNQQPTPSPAAMSGSCTAVNCTGTTSVSVNPSLSFSVSYVLTPP